MKVICLFPSVHFVLRAEKVLKDRGLRPKLVPVPKEISSDCGMAIEIDFEDLSRLGNLPPELKPEAFYLRTPQGYQKLLDS